MRPLGTLAWRGAVAVIAFAGVALRLSELGTWGLSNDEAWVALATRVVGLDQMWLAIAMTPVAWAALVKLAATVLGGSELALRTVPFAFGCLTMRAALGVGRRAAGHRLGGLLALAFVAFDPLEIAYAKVLKQYTAETFFCLVALDRALVFATRRDRRSLVALSLVLALGVAFANAQLFLAPPVFAVLLADALVRGDRRGLRDILVAAAVVGTWDMLYARLVLAPRLPSALDAYWNAQTYLPADPMPALRILWDQLGWTLAPALGRAGYVAAMLCLVLACLLPRRRVAAAALVLVVGEIVALSVLHRVPVSQPRVLLFLTAALGVVGAASVARMAARAFVRPRLAALALPTLALLAWDFARAHPWTVLARSTHVEDAGPLVRRVEDEREPADIVLLHQTTLFVFAYYQRATPVLYPLPTISVGYLPRPPDARVLVADDRDLAERARGASATSRRVWFLASRLRAPRERQIRAALAPLGPPALEQRRPGALLLRFDR